MNLLHRIVLLALNLLFFQIGLSQDLYVQKMGVREGLKSTTIYDILQDSKGYIWLSSDVGVSRYDGYRFENFTTQDGLPDNDVLKLYQDRSDRIWFLTFSGEVGFYTKGKFYNKKNKPILGKIDPPSMIISIIEDESGSIYITFASRWVYKLSSDLKKIEKLSFGEGRSFLTWFPNRNQLTLTSKGIYNLQTQKYKKKIDLKRFVRTAWDGDQLYFNQGGTLFSMNKNFSIDTITSFEGDQLEIISINRFDKRFWIGTNQGLWIENAKGVYKQYLKEVIVSKVFQDNEGNYWISTLEDGVYFHHASQMYKYDSNSGLAFDKIRSVRKDQSGNIWAGSIRNYYYVIRGESISVNTVPSDRLDEISTIRRFGNVIILAGKGGTHIFKNGSVFHMNLYSDAIELTNKGDLFFGLEDVRSMKFSSIEAASRDKKFRVPPGRKINTRICEIKSAFGNQLIIGAIDGVYICDDEPKTSNFRRFTNEISSPVSGIIYDRKTNVVYVATQNEGLFVLDSEGKLASGASRFLAGQQCTSIRAAEDGSIFVATTDGFYCLDGRKKLINYSRRLGLSRTKVEDIEIDGDLIYLATNEGLLFFDKSIELKNVRPIIYLTEALINGKKRDFESTIEMDYTKDGNALFRFVGLSYRELGQLSYMYSLSGDKLIETKSREVDFRDLQPGKYVFRVKAITEDGIESETVSVPFVIHPPFWKTIWFQILLFAIGLGVIFLIVHFRLKKVRNAHRLEQEETQRQNNLLDLEQKALRLQMNPHFVFNALSTIKGYYAENEERKASAYITVFSRLMRSILENNEKFIPLEKEMKVLELYMQMSKFRYGDDFQYEVKWLSEEPIEDVLVANMVVQPFVENSIIHGLAPRDGKGMISVRFFKENQQLICEVEDDGVGRQDNASTSGHVSVSTSITKQRLELIKGKDELSGSFEYIDLTTNEGKARGTLVRIHLPYKDLLDD